MSLASLVSILFTSGSTQQQSFAPSNEGWPASVLKFKEHGQGQDTDKQDGRRQEQVQIMEEEEEARPPYLHVCWLSPSERLTAIPRVSSDMLKQAMLAGGIGGTTGDLLMHSIDTVKTRQQGDPHIPPKYTSLSSTYSKIFRQEGVRRGLYSGVTPAFLGSFPGTVIFFGVYEYSKRHLIDAGVHQPLAYLAGGMNPV
jgi:hypothetical protein